MTKVKLLNGPCDPRDVEMLVSLDAQTLSVRPMPFLIDDIYVVTDRFVDGETLSHVTAEYLHTVGPRPQVEKYRKEIARVGSGRAFRVKRAREGRIQ